MTTLTTIASHLNDVTSEQIGRCHKVYDFQSKQNFYLVENSRGEYNEAGELIEYKVSYDKKGFHCDCESGKRGWVNVHHPSGVCWHVRASVAAAQEERAAMLEQAAREHVLMIDGKEASKEEYERVMTASKPVDRKAKPIQPKAFSLLK